ncbi:hypothetical protein N657DRAFT_603964 [Parathielavia appendiculata]|uniref:Uncharacterized protein n=1 Tax=Parathielavia appendiculata TaxID=2587402 RepID=A0AAN6YZR1_9PEZI|nr:hypothetical protein N657DRAFT_603964 [Parathielavia appendiculata]
MNRLVLALLPVAFAAPALQLAAGTKAINVVLQINKATSEAAIDVLDENKSTVFAHSCSRTLASGSFASSPLAFTVNEQGAGTLSVGPQTYTIHDQVEYSGGIVCGRVASPGEVVVSCQVPVPSSLQLHSLNKRDLQDCFPHGPVELSKVVEALESEGAVTSANDTVSSVTETQDVAADAADKRQYNPCSIWSSATIMVGNGNPHQNPLHIQLSEPMQCGQSSCEVGYSQARSFTVGWTASLSAAQWISGGFSVESTIETGNQHVCHGQAHEYFAIWKNQAQTAYTVQNALYNACTGMHPSGSHFVMWSPNRDNRGGNYYCVYGRQYVRWIGDRWLDTAPHTPGGPP